MGWLQDGGGRGVQGRDVQGPDTTRAESLGEGPGGYRRSYPTSTGHAWTPLPRRAAAAKLVITFCANVPPPPTQNVGYESDDSNAGQGLPDGAGGEVGGEVVESAKAKIREAPKSVDRRQGQGQKRKQVRARELTGAVGLRVQSAMPWKSYRGLGVLSGRRP